MNTMLRIKKDDDILKYSEEFYADNTDLQRKTAAYDLTGNVREGPSLTPMQVDWRNLNGRWNSDLFDLFKSYAEEEGYGKEDGMLCEDEEDELRDIFFNRLKRLKGIISANRPRASETMHDAQRRLQARKDEVAASKRRNTRREGVSPTSSLRSPCC